MKKDNNNSNNNFGNNMSNIMNVLKMMNGNTAMNGNQSNANSEKSDNQTAKKEPKIDDSIPVYANNSTVNTLSKTAMRYADKMAEHDNIVRKLQDKNNANNT